MSWGPRQLGQIATSPTYVAPPFRPRTLSSLIVASTDRPEPLTSPPPPALYPPPTPHRYDYKNIYAGLALANSLNAEFIPSVGRRIDEWLIDKGIKVAITSLNQIPNATKRQSFRGDDWQLVMERGPKKDQEQKALKMPPGSAFVLTGRAQGSTTARKIDRGMG